MTLPVPASMDPELQARALANLGGGAPGGNPAGSAMMPPPPDVTNRPAPPPPGSGIPDESVQSPLDPRVAPFPQVPVGEVTPAPAPPPPGMPPADMPPGLPPIGTGYPSGPEGAVVKPQPAPGAPMGPSPMSAQEGRLLASYDAEKAAKEAERSALTGKLAVESEGRTKQSALLAQQAAEMQEFDAHVNKAVDEEIGSMRAAMEDIRNTKIDPMGFFNSKDDGQKAMFVLIQMASGVAGAFQTLGKGENPAITQLNRLMDRDMAAQESNLKNKHAALQAQNTIFGQMVQKFGMSRETKLKYQTLALESFKTHLEGEMASATSPVVQAQIQGNIAAIDKEQQQKGLEILRAAQQRAAAGYAAQKAAQQQAFENSLKVLHAQNETTNANAAMLKAQHEGGDKTAQAVERYGKELVEKKIPQALSTIEHAKANLPPPGQDIPGVGPIASKVPDLLVGEDGRAARQQLGQLFNAYRVVVTGAGASVEELDRLERAAMGAKTTRELWEFISAGQDVTNAAKAAIDKQFSPAVRSQYEGNLPNSGRPPSLQADRK